MSLFLSGTLQAQTIRYVKQNGAGNGSSWANASSDLQAMISATGVQEVWVAAGVYKPGGNGNTNRSVSFSMKNGVTIYGGFPNTGNPVLPDRNWQLNSTILSGDIDNDGTLANNSSHVISNPAGLTITAVLDGFVITGGNANGSSFPGNSGGGVYNSNVDIGSGFYCSPTFRNCSFQANSAVNGGAIFNNGFNPNGNSSPVLTNCVFLNNSATTNGGAVFNEGSNNGNSSPVLTNCSLQGNTASQYGGAIFNNGGSSGNSRPQLTNCSLLNNTTSSHNGQVFYNESSNLTLVNTIVWNGGRGNPFYQSNSPAIQASYCLIDANVNPSDYTTGGPGNRTTTTSPFASETSVALFSNSPAIDAGNPASQTVANGPYSAIALPTTDLAGNPRIAGCGVDMGAVEVQGAPNITRLYVNANAGGSNSGQDWNNAFTDLQSALNYPCSRNLTEIWVAAGTYYPDEGPGQTNNARSSAFSMKNGISILGGFPATGNPTLSDRSPGNFTTILSGDLDKNNTLDNGNSYHVISNPAGLTTTAVLDGFVITAGNANGSDADGRGGGVYNNGSGSSNVCSPSFRNCSLRGNRADFGGAMFNNGYISGQSSPVLTNCSFVNNSAQTHGGAMYNWGDQGRASPVLTNCSFTSNSASQQGGAMHNNGLNSGTSSPQLTNSVLWNNGNTNTFYNSNASVTLSYCLYEPSIVKTGVMVSGAGNLTTNTSPFASTTSVTLNACSPAINAGNNSATGLTGITTDLVGNPRFFNNGRVDMGAVEFQAYPGGIATQPATGSAVCIGGAVSVSISMVGTEPFTYQWYKNNFSTPVASQTAATLSLTNITTANAGNYSVVVTGACSATSSAFSLTVNALPNPTLTPSDNGTLNCSITQITLTATGGTSYLLSDTQTSNDGTFFVSNPDTFTVTATDDNGCSATATTTVYQDIESPKATLSASSTLLTCSNSSVTLTAGGGVSYLWQDNTTTDPTRTLTHGGYFDVEVVGANGCSSTTSIIVQEDKFPPSVSIQVLGAQGTERPTLSCANPSLILTAEATPYSPANTYVWNTPAQDTQTQLVVHQGGNYAVSVTGANGCSATSDEIRIYEDLDPPMNVQLSSDLLNNQLTCANPQATLTASGGVSYQWEDNSTDPVRTVQEPTSYTVTVTGMNGCTATASITLSQDNTHPIATIDAPDQVLTCRQPTLTLTALGGSNYRWDDGSTNPIRAVTAEAMYSVTVTGSNGCTATESVEITADQTAPIVSLQATTTLLTCNTTSAVLLASLTVDDPDASYSWDDNSNDPNRSVSEQGTYSVTVTSANGCTATASITIGTNTTAPTVTLTSSNSLDCGITSATLTASASGIDAYTFTFRGGSLAGTPTSNSTIVINEPANYTVLVTGTNGCTNTAITEVTSDTSAPAITLTSSNSLNCVLHSATLTASASGKAPFMYTFQGPNGFSSSLGSSSMITVNAPGTYTVLVTAASGCSATATTHVSSDTVAPDSPALSASHSSTLTCSVLTLTLTASPTGSYTYAFSSGANQIGSGNKATVNAPGMYSVVITNVNGCTALATTEVFSNTTAPAVSLASSNSLNCAVTSATLSASATGFGSLTYTFRGTGLSGSPSNTSTVVVNNPDTYTVLVTGANGCSQTATTTVASDTALPTNLSLTSGILTCAQTSLTLTASATNGDSFTFSGGTKLGNNQVVVNQPGVYTVIVSNASGCTALTTSEVISETTSPTVSLASSNSLNCLVTSATLTATASGFGSLSYTFQGKGLSGSPSSTSTLVVNAPDTYTVLVTATNGCTQTATTTVSSVTAAPTGLSLSASNASTITCGVPTLTLTASPTGSYTYAFSTGANQIGSGSTATVNAPGVYSVTVTDANGCSSFTSTQVFSETTAALVTLASSNSLNCAVTSATLTANATGVGSLTYAFTGGNLSGSPSSNSTVTVNAPGTYTVLVTAANSCTARNTVTIASSTTAPRVSILPSANQLTCTLSSITLTASTDGSLLRWSDGSTNPTLVVSGSGTYGLSVTGTNGCTASATPVVINQDLSALAGLALGSSSPSFGCGGGTITLTATPAGADSYRFAGPSLTQTGSQPTALATQTGTYSVTATKGICTAIASISLGGTVGNPPNALLLGTGSLSCQTPTLSLTAVGGTYYTITGPGVVSQSDGSESIIIGSYIINRRPIPTVGMAIVNKPGTYTVLVTDEKGCTATASILVTGTECAPPR